MKMPMMQGFEDMPDDEAAEAPESDSADETPLTEEGQHEPVPELVSIPASMLGDRQMKAGERLMLKIVSVDGENVQAAVINGDDMGMGMGDGYSEPGAELDSMAAQGG